LFRRPADASQEEEESFSEAAKQRFIQQRYVSDPDSLQELLGASTIFDMYQLTC